MPCNYHESLRRVTQKDAEALTELECLLFPDNALNETSLAVEIGAGFGWVCGDDPVAYALVRDDMGLLDLTRLGVHPQHQRQGLGELLLRHVLGLGKPTMLTVRKENTNALRLYRKYGFQVVGHLTYAPCWLMLRG